VGWGAALVILGGDMGIYIYQPVLCDCGYEYYLPPFIEGDILELSCGNPFCPDYKITYLIDKKDTRIYLKPIKKKTE
jgi:hypothetical protein